MSSRPGFKLEDLLRWDFDLKVEGLHDANTNLRLAELIGTATKVRRTLTPEQFAPIVAIYEEVRDTAERLLEEYDEETQSWRDYAGYSFDRVLTRERGERVREYLATLTETV